MLALYGAALAAPLHPVVLPGGGPDAALSLTWSRDLLVDRACATCDAWRDGHAQTLHAGWQLVPAVGLYGTAAHVRETVGAAEYTQQGFGFSGGARVDVPVGRSSAVEIWGEVAHTWSGVVDPSGAGDGAARIETEAGAALRAGGAKDGIFVWIGAAVTPWTDDRSLVLDGSYLLHLRPLVPVEAVGGVGYVSEPLAGPWNDRSRMIGGLRGTAGWRNGVTGWVGAAF
jgi:hypothetical protein